MHKTRIAIVEDDADDRDFIKMSLGSSNELEITLYDSGSDFLDFIRNGENYPDLIITDLRMPVISGFDVIQRLKECESTKDIPVVVLSTSSNSADIDRAKQLGAVAFYVKPYTLKEYNTITTTILENFRISLLRFSTQLKLFLNPHFVTPAIP